MIFQGIRTSIAKKPYIFVIFQEGGGGVRTPCPLSGIRAWKYIHVYKCIYISDILTCDPSKNKIGQFHTYSQCAWECPPMKKVKMKKSSLALSFPEAIDFCRCWGKTKRTNRTDLPDKLDYHRYCHKTGGL